MDKLVAALVIFLSSLNPFKLIEHQTQPAVVAPTQVIEVSITPSPAPTLTRSPSITKAKAPKPTATPTIAITTRPTITNTPVPTKLPAPTATHTPIDSRDITLTAPANSPIPNGIVKLQINIVGSSDANTSNPNYKIFTFTWNATAENLHPNKSYALALCIKNNGCTSLTTPDAHLNTDQSGKATASLPPPNAIYGGVGITVDKNNPITTIVLTEPSECPSSKPCLAGDYPLTVGF